MKKFRIFSAIVAIVMAFSLSVSAAEAFVYDFDDYDPGDSVTFTDMGYDGWNAGFGTPDSTADIASDDDGNYIAVTGFTELRGPIIMSEYAFGLAIRAGIGFNGEGGVFVRASNPADYTILNTAHDNTAWDMTLNFFESDWYRENGGQDGNSGIGGSGIYISPVSEGLRLIVKKQAEDGAHIANVPFVLPYPAGTNADTFTDIDFYDDGQMIEIYANGAVLATIELSEPGKVYETDKAETETINEYFGKAIVKDATGAELGTVENTRICSSSSMVAIGARATNLDFTDLSLYIGENAISESKEAEPQQPADTNAPATNAPATNAPATGASTNAPATNASTNASTNAGDNTGSSEGGLPTGAIIGIVIAVIAVVAVVVVVIMKKKK